MWDIIKFTIKAAIVLVLVYLILQLDYNGRKISTYVTEAFRSYKVKDTVDTVKTKVGVGETKKSGSGTRIVRTLGHNGKDHKTVNEASDKERKELEKLMEQK